MIFMMLHPDIWGKLPLKESAMNAATVLGYSSNTTPYNWLALPDKKGKSLIDDWFSIVERVSRRQKTRVGAGMPGGDGGI